MRMITKYLVGLVALVFLYSCGSVPINEPVKVVLTPVHKYSALKPKPKKLSEISQADIGDSRLYDNDGNEYWQYWDLRGKKRSEFRNTVEKCKINSNKNKINYNQVALGDINVSEIRPSLYKGYVKCISEYGFKFVFGDGFFPDKYRLMISREFSRHRKYIPVRGEFYIKKMKTDYKDVVKHVKKCEQIIINTLNQGTKDEYFRGFVSVSLKPYTKSMISCLNGYSYKIKSALNKKEYSGEEINEGTKETAKPNDRSQFLLEYK